MTVTVFEVIEVLLNMQVSGRGFQSYKTNYCHSDRVLLCFYTASDDESWGHWAVAGSAKVSR